jgi:DegV family protein with EDD domain
MGQIKVVTDSAADLPISAIANLGITVVPIGVRVGGKVLRDNIDINSEEFFAQLSAGSALAVTEAPSVEAFRETYAALSATTDQILSIHISSKLSSTFNNARRAASAFLGRNRIVVMDSQLTSWGQGLLAIAAAEAAARGSSMDEIVRLLRGMIAHIYIVFFVESLDYLERSAHLDKSQAILGTMLNVKPLLIIEDGEIVPLEKVRTRGKAVDRLQEFVAEFAHLEKLIVVRGRRTAESQDLLERVAQTFPGKEVMLGVYSPSLATHLGADAMGVIAYEGL